MTDYSSFLARSIRAWRSRDWSRSVLTFGVVLYTVRVVAPGWRSGFPAFFPDSSSYEAVSRLGPFDPSFWWSERPMGVPLVLWLSGGNERLFFLLQTLLFALSIAYLCSVLLEIIGTRWLAWVTCAAVTAIGVQPRFGLWHLELLSESLSLTTSVFVIATWLNFAVKPIVRNLVVGVIATIVWMSTRDVHIVTGFIIATVLILVAFAARKQMRLRRAALLGSIALVTFTGYVLIAQDASQRFLYPLINNVGERVLTEPDVLSTFVDGGMPLDDALLARAGSDAWADEQEFLRSPDLEDFRSWAREDGRRALMESLVVDAPYWIRTTGEALADSLDLDFAEYDRHSTSERLPTRLFWFQGPRSTMQLSIWVGIALGAVAALALRHRRLAALGSAAVVALAADTIVSASGDSVEVQRHLLGSIFRIGLVLTLMIALAVDIAIRHLSQRRASRREGSPGLQNVRTRISIPVSLTASLAIVGVFGAWVAIEHRSQDFDPQYARTIVERAARFGGTYYENGVHNKGPLETAVYDSVRIFTGYDTYWFGISAYVLIVSAVLGWVAWSIARSMGGHRRLAGTGAALVFVHFAISSSDYAGVLYSRNMTTAILSLCVGVALWDRPWRKPATANLVLLGLSALLGLAIQTLLTTVFAAVVVGVFLLHRRSSSTSLRHPILAMAAAVAASVSTAPVWYAIRGSFAEFWSNWWTYASYMSSSTGRSLLNQIGLGLQNMFGYYQERPVLLVLFAVFFFVLRRNWSQMSTSSRSIHLLLTGWLSAGWIELVLSQRYSSHYFSIVAIPTALIGVVTAVAVADILSDNAPSMRPRLRMSRAGASILLPLSCVVTVLAVQGTHVTWIGIEAAGRFKNADHYVQAREQARSGALQTRRAVMDLVSGEDDAMLAWTMYPWTYLDHRRVPATRFSWKSFLIGEIYLGRTSPEYVLDRTWEWFDEDLRESRPEVYARPVVTELVADTPFADLVSEEFATVYVDDELEIGWPVGIWQEVSEPLRPGSPATSDSNLPKEDLPESWSMNPTTGSITALEGSSAWELPFVPCQRITTRLVRTSNVEPTALAFVFMPIDSTRRAVSLNIDFERSWSAYFVEDDDSDSAVEIASTNFKEAATSSIDVVLLVAESAAAIVSGGRIVSAVRLDGEQRLFVTSSTGSFTIAEPSSRPLDGLEGC